MILYMKVRKIMKLNKKLAILNTSILTSEGEYKLKDITLEEARKLIKENEDNLLSVVGHQSTVEIINTLLNSNIEMNRITFDQEIGQIGLVFKLIKRPPEGSILTKEQLEEYGYKFQLLEKIN